MSSVGFRRFSLSVLAYNLGVIAFGAYVRATGSGAGCGSHWPTCGGQVVPHAPAIATVIEYTHRLTSGLDGLLVLGLLVWAFVGNEKGHPARWWASVSFFFILTEGAVGAALVLLQHVAHDASVGRAGWVGLHLLNTLLLLLALTFTAHAAATGTGPRLKGQGAAAAWLGVGLVIVAGVSAAGAVTALGDTLFPVASLDEGVHADFSPAASFLVRLRILHPVLAVTSVLYLLVLCRRLSALRRTAGVERAGYVLMGLALSQILVGLANLVLLAPVALQLVHLVWADLVWLALGVLTARALSEPSPAANSVAVSPSRPGLAVEQS